MENQMQLFKNEQFGDVRVIEEAGKFLFCGSDVAKALGYAIPSKAVNTHCKGVSKMEAPSPGGMQTMLFISEGDVYRLITHSKLPPPSNSNDGCSTMCSLLFAGTAFTPPMNCSPILICSSRLCRILKRNAPVLLSWDEGPNAVASRLKLLYNNEDHKGKAMLAGMDSVLKDVLPANIVTAFRKPDGTLYAMVVMEHAPDENILNKMR